MHARLRAEGGKGVHTRLLGLRVGKGVLTRLMAEGEKIGAGLNYLARVRGGRWRIQVWMV